MLPPLIWFVRPRRLGPRSENCRQKTAGSIGKGRAHGQQPHSVSSWRPSNGRARPMSTAATAGTLFDKIWDAHVVQRFEGGRDLIFIDRHVLQETTCAPAFEGLRRQGRSVA